MRQRFGFRDRAAPVASPTPEMTLITPSGMPISLAKCATYRVDSGVSSAGLITQVLPVIVEGKILPETVPIGKFQGAMPPTTPRGA